VAPCAGTYTTTGNRLGVAPNAAAAPRPSFDANSSVTDGELHLDDFYGIAQVDVFLATQPLEKVD